MTIKDWIEVAHQNAIDKGFWDKPRNDGEIIALWHSELSATLEAMRSKEPDAKEKIGEELADLCIRIFDYCGGRDIDLEELLSFELSDKSFTIPHISLELTMRNYSLETENDGEAITILHAKIGSYYLTAIDQDAGPLLLAPLLMAVIWFANKKEIDLEKAIAEKVKRNQSRAFMHNKKF